MLTLIPAARGWSPVSSKLGLAPWFLLLAVAGCGTSASLPDTGIRLPSPTNFPYCRNHTCETIKTLKFSDQQWAAITAPLSRPSADAAEERARIAVSVATYERKAAMKAGTTNDRGGTIVGFFRQGQLDCVDEASNTDTLLFMLDNQGLLRWHRRGPPRMRLVILSDGVPHVTATVIDLQNGDTYAVDSWFRDNGEPADVVPLGEWLDGWNPPEGEEHR
jgi:hypothetical protein